MNLFLNKNRKTGGILSFFYSIKTITFALFFTELHQSNKNVKEESLSVSAANQALTVNLEARMWKFIVRTINYPELRFDSTTDSICFMSYIPFTTLAKEWIAGNTEGLYDVRKCEDCGEYFDVNKTDGIYGNPGDLEEFICFPCAERMTAREYYERFIER